MDKKVKNSKADTLFRGGLEGRQAFWTLRQTKKLGTRSKVGNLKDVRIVPWALNIVGLS